MLRRPPRRTRPLVERLEDRAVPTTVTVSGGVLKITGNASSEAVTFRTRDASRTQVLSGSTIIATVLKSTYTKVAVALAAGNDSFKIDASKGSPIPKGGLTLDGGIGNDKLIGPNSTLLWKITGANAGTVSDGITFNSIENLTGGTGADHFRYAGGSFSGNIDGGGGSDLVDYSGLTKASTTVAAPTFAGIPNLKLNGSAAFKNTSDGAVARLTPAKGSQSGSLFGTRRVAVNAFSTAFTFRITNRGGGFSDGNSSNGADGLVFVLAAGGANTLGGGIGYSGTANDIGVEFDTWHNSGNGDPSANHIGLDLDGSLTSVVTANVATPFKDGKLWHVWIDYDGTTLKVYATEAATKPAKPTLSTAVDIPKYLGNEIGYAGLTAGTGGDWENHDIVSWNYTGALVADLSDGSITNVEDVAGSGGLDFLAGPNTTNTWTVTTGTGSLNGKTSFSLFDGLVGGSQNDTFKFKSGSLAHSVTGAQGINALDYSATGTNVTADLSKGIASRVGKRVMGIQNLTGGAGNDTLIGDANDNILSGGPGADTLDGGTGDDTFAFNADTPIGSDTIKDAGGRDTLDFGANNTTRGITVNLGLTSTQTVNANLKLTLASSASIENVIGTGGNDVITGNSLVNVLLGRNGNDTLLGGIGPDILVGDNGSDNLQGGTGQDLLIGGSTTHGTAMVSWNGMAREWGRSDDNYETRYEHLRGLTGGGKNGFAYLQNKNINKDSGAVDTLTGDPSGGPAELDWYIYSAEDKIVGFASGEHETLI